MNIVFRTAFTNEYGDKIEHPFKFWSLGLTYYNKTINLNLLWWRFGFSWRKQACESLEPR